MVYKVKFYYHISYLLWTKKIEMKQIHPDSSLSLEHFSIETIYYLRKNSRKKLGKKSGKNIRKKVGKNNREKVKKKVRQKWECRKRVKAINNSLTYGPCMLVLSLWYLTNWKYSRNLVAYSYTLPIILDIGKINNAHLLMHILMHFPSYSFP